MSEAVQHIKANDVASPRGWRIDPRGLVVVRSLALEEWLAVGTHLAQLATGTTWAVGDWLVFGAGGDYGRRYLEAIETFEKTWEQLREYQRVSAAFPREARVVGLSWSHHREALRLLKPDRTRALQLAATNEWTRNAFALYIDSRLGRETELLDVGEDIDEDDAEALTQKARGGPRRKRITPVRCPHCGQEFMDT